MGLSFTVAFIGASGVAAIRAVSLRGATGALRSSIGAATGPGPNGTGGRPEVDGGDNGAGGLMAEGGGNKGAGDFRAEGGGGKGAGGFRTEGRGGDGG